MQRQCLRGPTRFYHRAALRAQVLFFALFFSTLSLLHSEAAAQTLTHPDPLAGWVHSETRGGVTADTAGVILPGNDVQGSSPVIAEIDGDTANGKEVVVAVGDGIVYAYHSDGTLLWQHELPNKSCGKQNGRNHVYSAPSVGALYGDGVPYVVIGYGGVAAGKCPGGVVAIKGSDGTRAWKFDLREFAASRGSREKGATVYSSPALADVDGDGKLEVGFGGFDRNVYLLNYDGTLRWYYNAADTVWSSPVFVNVDGDSNLEMVFATDITQNPFLRPPTKNGGMLYAFKTKKLPGNLRRIPFRDAALRMIKWSQAFDQVLFSSPVVGDVLASNPGNEIVIGSGCYFPEKTTKKKGNWFKVIRPRDGKVLQTLPVSACSSSSAAIGDIDGDGKLEIVVTVNGDKSVGGDGSSRVMAFKAASKTPLWTFVPQGLGRRDSFGGNFISPVIADIDGNGSLEVIVPNSTFVYVLDGATGLPLVCNTHNCVDNSLVLDATERLVNSAAVGDLDSDGTLEIVAAGGSASNAGHGAIYAWTNLMSVITSTSGSLTPFAVPWGRFRSNARGNPVFGE